MRVALLGGLTAAALDLVYAFVVYGVRGVMPITILQSIGSGWLGNGAYQQGWSSALLGLVSHTVMLCVAAVMYGYVRSRSSYVTSHTWIAGALYGLLIFVVMNFVIVPLSAANASLPQGGLLLGSLCAHVFLVGIPIAFVASRQPVTAPSQ